MTQGWPVERRATQAARIRAQKPWLCATGPRTKEGKARVRGNSAGRGCQQRWEAEVAEIEAILGGMEAERVAMLEAYGGEEDGGGEAQRDADGAQAGRGSGRRRRAEVAGSEGVPGVAPYMVPLAVDLGGDRPPRSPLDGVSEAEDLLARVQMRAIKAGIVWQLAQAMRERKLSRRKLAPLMRTSRPQVDRLLDPDDGNVTIETLQRAAAAVGRRVELALA